MKSAVDPFFENFSRLLTSSFPENERRPMSSLKDIMEKEDRACCNVVLMDEVFVGMLLYWNFIDFVYVEYIAVDPDIRGGGLGARILSLLKETAGVPLVLEVEPPHNDLARRRIGFYERNGFVLLDEPYFQPSYGMLPGLELKLMSSGKLRRNIPSVISVIHENVYGVKGKENEA